MNLKPQVTVNGAIWNLFCIYFDSQEGQSSAYFYAVDHTHAMDRFEELKATGKIWSVPGTQNASSEIETLEVENRMLRARNERQASEIAALQKSLKDRILERNVHIVLCRELQAAIRKTLADNGHLADGDNCTLIDLKKVMNL